MKQAKLAFLKQIVWPEIMALAKTEIARYEEEAKNETNEVWMTFAPESWLCHVFLRASEKQN